MALQVLEARHAADQLDELGRPVDGDPVAQGHRLGRADRGQHPGQAEHHRDERDPGRRLARVAGDRAVDQQPVSQRVAGAGDGAEDEHRGDQRHPAGGGAEAVEEQDRRQAGEPPRRRAGRFGSTAAPAGAQERSGVLGSCRGRLGGRACLGRGGCLGHRRCLGRGGCLGVGLIGHFANLAAWRRYIVAYVPRGRDELVVAAALGDHAAVENVDAGRAPHGGEPVRDHQRGQPRRDLVEPLVEPRLGPHVERGRRLVKYQDARAVERGEESAGERQALPLAAGELGAARQLAGEDGVPPVRQLLDHGREPGEPRRALHALAVIRVLKRAERHVVVGRQRVPDRVLRHQRDHPLPAGRVELAHVRPVHGDPAAGRVAEPGEQADQRGLARAVDADERGGGAGAQLEINSGEHVGRLAGSSARPGNGTGRPRTAPPRAAARRRRPRNP